MRITLLYPTTNWASVWKKLHGTWASNAMKANLYTVIYDIQPTYGRLHTIRLTDSALCTISRKRNTSMHKLTEFG